MGYHLGIDAGTTYTAAAVRRGSSVTVLGLGNRAMQIPSVVYLDQDGSYLVGEAAEARAGAEPDRVAREFKRRIGDPVPIIVGGTPVSAEQLTARLLSWVVALATEREGGAPETITVSHPANWGAYKIDHLRQVFALADLTGVRTCTEPEAAAITYATRQRVDPGACVAVYDLGGGTFDAAVLRNTDNRFTMLGAPEGIEHLGGVDFDEAVFQHVLRTVEAGGQSFDADDPAVLRGLERLRRDCVLAKESLSADTDAVIAVNVGAVDSVVRLTRGEFEAMIRPALDETVAAMRRVLRSADVAPQELTAIVLVGGSSRIPLVSEVLAGAFGRSLALDTHPKHDIAVGAAWLGAPPELMPKPAADGASTAAPVPVTEETAAVPAAPPPVRPRPRISRRAAYIAIAAAVAVVAAVVLGITLASGSGSPTAHGSDAAHSRSSTLASTPPPSTPASSTTTVASLRPMAAPLADNVILWSATRNRVQQIWRIDSDGSDAHVVVRGPDVQHQAISHDRRTIAYPQTVGAGATAFARLRIAASDGTHDRPLYRTPSTQCQNAGRPAFSADDTMLAVACQIASPNGTARFAIRLVDMSGTFVGAPLATGNLGDLTFNHDGTDVGYWEANSNNAALTRLAEVNVTGPPQPKALTGWLRSVNDATFSPVDDSIAMRIGNTENNFEIYVLRPGAKTPVRLTHNTVPDQDPSWSPDGKQIAYKRGPSLNADIWVMNADGTHQHPLVTSRQPDTTPSWSAR